MHFYNLKGKLINNTKNKHRVIKWDAPSPRSKFQTKVKAWLRPYWEDDFVVEEFVCFGRCSLDLVNIHKRVAIEVQGEQHQREIKFFHRTSYDWGAQLQRDIQKAEWCRLNKILYLEINSIKECEETHPNYPTLLEQVTSFYTPPKE